MKHYVLIFLTAIVFMAACNANNSSAQQDVLSEKDLSAYLALGDSIANHAQTALLLEVSSAIKQGGTDYAVEFCNTRAIPLTDSMGMHYEVSIQRLSDKNRNPDNGIQSPMDQKAWKKITTEKKHLIQQETDGRVFYYKPIMIGMETCLKCHGSKEDIAISTQEIIAQKYTADKAIGYQMGDLRGMWKIALSE